MGGWAAAHNNKQTELVAACDGPGAPVGAQGQGSGRQERLEIKLYTSRANDHKALTSLSSRRRTTAHHAIDAMREEDVYCEKP
jgi:hypothetical protein